MVLSAGVVVIRPAAEGQWQYLLLRAYRHWDFPKGQVEPGETAFDAALREVSEETTLTDLDFRWGDSFFETPPYNRGKKVARYYLAASLQGEVILPVNPALGRPEHNEFRWVSLTEAKALVSPRVNEVLRWAEQQLAAAGGD